MTKYNIPHPDQLHKIFQIRIYKNTHKVYNT